MPNDGTRILIISSVILDYLTSIVAYSKCFNECYIVNKINGYEQSSFEYNKGKTNS